MSKTATAALRVVELSPIDQLGDIRAQIADLVAVEKALIEEVKALGPGAHEGGLFRATVTESVRETISSADMKAKLESLGVDGRWFAHHTKVSPVVTVRVVARRA